MCAGVSVRVCLCHTFCVIDDEVICACEDMAQGCVCVFVCVCVTERNGEREREFECASMCVSVFPFVCTGVSVHVCVYVCAVYHTFYLFDDAPIYVSEDMARCVCMCERESER